jgi:nicotinate-nucleotide adenylyltransferase
MKIGIFGGAFDPPTIGHKEIAISLTKVIDEVWLMPCYQSAFGKKMSKNEDRLEMCRLVTKNLDNVKTSDFEITNQITGGTIYCVEELLKAFPDHQFYWIIGQDNANVFHHWHRNEELKKLIPFIVVPRQGYKNEKNELWYNQKPHLHLEDLTLPEVSSTLVRGLISTKKRVEHLVENDVRSYIEAVNLYKE